jgi:hypothetical protein
VTYAALIAFGFYGPTSDASDAVLIPLVVIASLALGYMVGAWRAIACALLFSIISIPSGYSGDPGPAWWLALFFLVPLAALSIAVGTAIRKASDSRARRISRSQERLPEDPRGS